MNFYTFILALSISLAALSLGLMSILVVRRVVGDRRARQHEQAKRDMLSRLLDRMADPDPESIAKIARTRREAGVLGEVIEHLLRSLSGEDRDRLRAALRFLGGQEEKIEILLRGEEWARVAAADSMGYFEEPRVVAALRIALHDSSANVRCAAARALMEIGAVRSARDLIDRLVVEASVPPQALRDIFRRLGPGFLEELTEVLRTGSEKARIVAIDSLSHSGDLRAVEPLLDLLDGASKDLAANVFRALALLGDPRALPAVQKGLHDPAWEVRCQAALCAGGIGAVESWRRLVELLDDPVWWVRYRSAEALYGLGEQGISILRSLSPQPSAAGLTAQLLLAEKAAA